MILDEHGKLGPSDQTDDRSHNDSAGRNCNWVDLPLGIMGNRAYVARALA